MPHPGRSSDRWKVDDRDGERARSAVRLKPMIGMKFTSRSGISAAGVTWPTSSAELDGGVHKGEAGHEHDEVGHQLDRREGPPLQDVVDDVDGDVPVTRGEVAGHDEREPHHRATSPVQGRLTPGR